MRQRFGKLSPIEIAMVFAPFVMGIAVYTAPVQSDTKPGTIPMAFDSVGAMLHDIDREKTLAAMAREEMRGNETMVASHSDGGSCPDQEERAVAFADATDDQHTNIDVMAEVAQIQAAVSASSFKMREIQSVAHMVEQLESERDRLIARIDLLTERSFRNYDRWADAERIAEHARVQLESMQGLAADIEVLMQDVDEPELAETIRAAMAAAQEALASLP